MSSEDSNSLSDKEQSPLTLHVVNMLGKKATLNAESDAKVGSLKCAIERLWSVPAEDQTLVHNGEVLCDDCTVSDSGLSDGDTLFLLSSLGGGFRPQRTDSPVDVSVLRRLENEIFVAMMAMGKLISKRGKEGNALPNLLMPSCDSNRTPLKSADGKDASTPTQTEGTPIAFFGRKLGRLLNSQLENVATKRRMKILRDRLRQRKTKVDKKCPLPNGSPTAMTKGSPVSSRCFGVTGRRPVLIDKIRIAGKPERKAASERMSRCECPIAFSENFRKAVLATADSDTVATLLKQNGKRVALTLDTETLPLTSNIWADVHAKFYDSFKCPQRLEKKRRCRTKLCMTPIGSGNDVSTSPSSSPPILQPADDSWDPNQGKERDARKAASCPRAKGLKGRCGRKLTNKKARMRAALRRKRLLQRLRKIEKSEGSSKKRRRKKGEKDDEKTD